MNDNGGAGPHWTVADAIRANRTVLGAYRALCAGPLYRSRKRPSEWCTAFGRRFTAHTIGALQARELVRTHKTPSGDQLWLTDAGAALARELAPKARRSRKNVTTGKL